MIFLGELRIGGAAEEELLEALHVEGRRRHAEDDRRRLPGGGAHGTGVADGAVDEDAVDALVAPLRGADRQIAIAAVGILFVDHAQRLVALAGQVLWTDCGQDAPDPVRESHFVFAAGRAVLEVLDRTVVVDRHVAAETYRQPPHEDDRDGHDDQQQDQETPLPAAFHRVCTSFMGFPSSLADSLRRQTGSQGFITRAQHRPELR
jgi:hypothetical protein